MPRLTDELPVDDPLDDVINAYLEARQAGSTTAFPVAPGQKPGGLLFEKRQAAALQPAISPRSG